MVPYFVGMYSPLPLFCISSIMLSDINTCVSLGTETKYVSPVVVSNETTKITSECIPPSSVPKTAKFILSSETAASVFPPPEELRASCLSRWDLKAVAAKTKTAENINTMTKTVSINLPTNFFLLLLLL